MTMFSIFWYYYTTIRDRDITRYIQTAYDHFEIESRQSHDPLAIQVQKYGRVLSNIYSPLKHGLDSGVVFQFIIHSYLTMLIWSKIGQLTIAGQWPGANICHTLPLALQHGWKPGASELEAKNSSNYL